MAKAGNIRELFTEKGCLSEKGLAQYNSRSVSPVLRIKLDDHIQSCDLCREAVKGYSFFDSDTGYQQGLEQLHKDWNRKHGSGFSFSRAGIAGLLSVAASVLLLAGLFFINKMQKEVRAETISELLGQGLRLSDVEDPYYITLVSTSENPRLVSKAGEDSAREDFKNNYLHQEVEQIPLTVLEETQVFADHRAYMATTPPKQEPKKKPQLRYPFRVMSMPPPELEEHVPGIRDMSELFTGVEQMPSFKNGGLQEFSAYVSSRLQYPYIAAEQDISGRVYVQFTINEKGDLNDIKIIKSDHSILNNEVIRVLKNSPAWKAGIQGGRPVKVSMLMPVNFQLYR